MDLNKTIVTDSGGNVLYISPAVLSYLNRKTGSPQAYAAGNISKDTVVLLAGKELKESPLFYDLRQDCFGDLGLPCDADGPDYDRMLAMMVYQNHEVQPILKTGSDLFNRKDCLLDTVFFGFEVQVFWDEEQDSLLAVINGQKIDCRFSEGPCLQVIAADEEGVRYLFRNGGERRPAEELHRVLSGDSFPGYIDLTSFPAAGEKLEDVLQPELAAFLHKMEAGTLEYNYGLDKILLRKTVMSAVEAAYIQFDILDEEAVIGGIRKYTEAYQILQSASPILEGDPLPTTFRLLGRGKEISEIKRLLQKASASNITILLTGESGTGKTFLAKEIHNSSKRKDRDFIHVNCAAIPYNLIESELFGYEEGAFTGAKKGGRKGYFELAGGGTVFLDEITELPLPLQGRLLEVIQDKTFYRVGGTQKIQADIRLIAATNRNLKDLVAARQFREDLYYRINVFPVELPPLRERIGDIFDIVTTILPEICHRTDLEPLTVSSQAFVKMRRYSWPGNIRELENILEKAAILCDGKVIMSDDIVFQEGEDAMPFGEGTLKTQKEQFEKKVIERTLARFKGEKGKTAKYLDIGRTNLFEKIRKYNIKDDSSGSTGGGE